MAEYFRKYYFEFEDTHPILPANWRVDILDSAGSTPSEPFILEMGPSPLVLERIQNEDAAEIGPIGWQATIQYVYTAEQNIPLPTEFFDAPERRFKVEVRKNNVLQGTFYIRPDGSEYVDQYPPTVISLTAVDGFSYMKGNVFNAFQESGLLLYDKISLYESMMTRGMLTVLENNPPINVIQTLYPANIEPDTRMLFGLFVHTDIFYDFVTGAVPISDMLNAFCRAFYANVFTSAGQIWFVRGQDLHGSSFEIDQYTDDETVTTTIDSDFVKVIGPTTDLDGVTMKPAATITPIPAIKKAEFEVEYKAINRLANFDWVSFIDVPGQGFQFEFWGMVAGNEQRGTGTVEDPYRAFLPYDPGDPGGQFLQQNPIDDVFITNGVGSGDIIQLSFPWKVINVEGFKIRLSIRSANPGSVMYMSSGGAWVPGVSTFIEIKRTKKKQLGSTDIKSNPIPPTAGGFSLVGVTVFLEIYTPDPLTTPSTQDGAEDPGVEIYPIKLGVSSSSSESRVVVVKNNADFSKTKEMEPFNFLDTGDEWLSNTLFVNPFGDYLPAEDWDNDKPLVVPADIERHMADSYIDQAPRSPMTWEGNVLSNTIDFHHPISITNHPSRRFKQIADVYDVKRAEHEMRLQEVFEEGTADVTYTEYDKEDEKDEND